MEHSLSVCVLFMRNAGRIVNVIPREMYVYIRRPFVHTIYLGMRFVWDKSKYKTEVDLRHVYRIVK